MKYLKKFLSLFKRKSGTVSFSESIKQTPFRLKGYTAEQIAEFSKDKSKLLYIATD